MKRNKVTALCMTLGLTVALILGGCGSAETSEVSPVAKSAITHDKDAKTDKDSKADKDSKSNKSDKDSKADKDSKSNKSDKTKSTKTTGTKSSRNKANNSSSTSGNNSKPSSGNNSKPSSGNSSKPSSGSSSKPSSGNSSKPSSGNSSKPSSGSSSKPSSGNSSKPSSENNSGNNSKPAHTHSYSSKVTKQPTCSAAGTRTYTCSCGKSSYTESIPATGNHKWKDQYELKKTPAKTHTENVYKQVCNGCGAQFDTAKEALEHTGMVFGDACKNYSSQIVDTITVVDVPAKEENVYIGTKCETCGAWK